MSQVADIYTKGFVKLSEPEGVDMIQADQYRLLNVRTWAG